ncbi:hypothetical protein [Brasilonema sennae]|uniref:hypothetical protein n=1 Tax=Brasilonema sennae TaxID=1397703 RepID=UPI0015C54791
MILVSSPEFTLTGHTYEVTSAAISPNGKTLVSLSYDKTINTKSLDRRKFHNLYRFWI